MGSSETPSTSDAKLSPDSGIDKNGRESESEAALLRVDRELEDDSRAASDDEESVEEDRIKTSDPATSSSSDDGSEKRPPDLLQQATRNIFVDVDVEVDVDILDDEDGDDDVDVDGDEDDDGGGGEDQGRRASDELGSEDLKEAGDGADVDQESENVGDFSVASEPEAVLPDDNKVPSDPCGPPFDGSKSMVATRDDWFASSESLPWTTSKIGVYNPVLKVFKCSDCEACIGFLARVAEHWLGTHANMRVFQCPRCPYNSAWARCVRMHYTRAHEPHGDLPETLMWKSSPILVQVDSILSNLKADVEASVIALPPRPMKESVGHTIPSRRSVQTAATGHMNPASSAGGHRSGKSRSKNPLNTHRSSSTSGSTTERKYACSYCTYSTDRRDLFTRHENIHKEEKPFVCFVCSKQFNRADHVKKHFLRIHPETPYDIKKIRRKPGAASSTLLGPTIAGLGRAGSMKNGCRPATKSFQLYPPVNLGPKVVKTEPPAAGEPKDQTFAKMAPHVIFPPLLRPPHLPVLPGSPCLLPLQIIAPNRPPIPDLILLSSTPSSVAALARSVTSSALPQRLPIATTIPTEAIPISIKDNSNRRSIEAEAKRSGMSTSRSRLPKSALEESFDSTTSPPIAPARSSLKRKASPKGSAPGPGTSPGSEDKKFFCSFCPWAGVDSWCLKRHINTHVKPYTCPLCDYKAARMERLQLHVGRVHCKKICSKCSVLFETQNEVDRHVEEEHVKLGQRPPKINCAECGATVESRSSLESHLIIVHGGTLLKCARCDFCTADPSTLDSHRLERHPDAASCQPPLDIKREPSTEDECPTDSSFSGSNGQVDLKHLNGHWSGRGLIFYQQALSSLPFIHPPHPSPHPPATRLELCAMNCEDDDEGKAVMKRRKQERPKKLPGVTGAEVTQIYECDQCDERYSKKAGLALHKMSSHGVGTSDKFKCGECGERFQKFSQLLSHLEKDPNCSKLSAN